MKTTVKTRTARTSRRRPHAIDFEKATEHIPRVVQASGSSFAMTVVEADSVAAETKPRGVMFQTKSLRIRLEAGVAPSHDMPAQLVIQCGDVLGDDDRGGYDTRLTIYHPDALRALASALLQLAADPVGAQILANLPDPEEE